MSLGGNLSSGYTNSLIDKSSRYASIKLLSKTCSDTCNNSGNSIQQPIARYPSMVLQSKKCTTLPANIQPPTASVPSSVPSSVRTQAVASFGTLSSPPVAIMPLPQDRFAKYNRFKAPVECPPVIQLSQALLNNSVPALLNSCNRF
jgi:hypothetical protein